MCTELISNNAAAALNIPVALSMARELKVNYRLAPMHSALALSNGAPFPRGTTTYVS